MNSPAPHPEVPGVLIVGAGEAGAGVAFALRQNGYADAITLIGDEPHPPYRRPPLSKGFLTGDVSEAGLLFRSAEAYERARIRGRYHRRVVEVDPHGHVVRLDDGSSVAYRYLVLATGGRARRLGVPGADDPRIHYVRTIADVRKLREQFQPGKRLLILGGGFIGLEIASVAITQGLDVTLAEAQPRLLARVSGPRVSDFYDAAHRKRGVKVLTNAFASAFDSGPSDMDVTLSDGRRLSADLIIAGVGMIPNTDLAEAAGLTVDNGIVVDPQLRTSEPDIFAVGDCCSYVSHHAGTRVRLESVPNAADHARLCAAAITGKPVPPQAVPWFWSDQYDLKLQIVGLSAGYDQLVIRGDPDAESFCAFYLREGVVISADAVNRPADFAVAKKLVTQRARPEAARLADENVPLKALLD